MGKTEKKRIVYGHIEHRSGSGTHSDKPKRERTREKQEKSWRKDHAVDE